jgi:hypothetical protein
MNLLNTYKILYKNVVHTSFMYKQCVNNIPISYLDYCQQEKGVKTIMPNDF